VSFAAITLCVASQREFIVISVYFVMIQSGNFWIHPRTFTPEYVFMALCLIEQRICRDGVVLS
jgi:hypothetical protein